MLRRYIAPDHSCLFACFTELCQGTIANEQVKEARQICSRAILSDPQTYCAAILGRPTEDYAKWIVNDLNWGGETELSILAVHFNVEVVVVPMHAPGTLLRYNNNNTVKGRIYVLYTGQHYDCLVGKKEDGTEERILEQSEEWDKLATVAAEEALNKWEEKQRQRVRKALKCQGCGAICDGNSEFQKHCEEVEHDDDFMFMCDEIEIVEDKDDVEARRIKEGGLDIQKCFTFYPALNVPLSNTWPSQLSLPNYPEEKDNSKKDYPTVEHYCQSQRFVGVKNEFADTLRALSEVEEMISTADYAGEGRGDWDNIRADVMRFAMRAKFSQYQEARDALLATGEQTIVMTDLDTWQGMNAKSGKLVGENNVGKILMEIRSELRNKK